MSSPVLFIIAALIWGSTFWAITLQLGEVAPAVSVVYRFGLASAAQSRLLGRHGAVPVERGLGLAREPAAARQNC